MSIDSGPTTKEELHDALDELLCRAYRNGVPIDNGGYALTHGDSDIPDWDLLVTRVEKGKQ